MYDYKSNGVGAIITSIIKNKTPAQWNGLFFENNKMIWLFDDKMYEYMMNMSLKKTNDSYFQFNKLPRMFQWHSILD